MGEWLPAFEGAWIVVANDPNHPLARHPAYLALHASFADDLPEERMR